MGAEKEEDKRPPTFPTWAILLIVFLLVLLILSLALAGCALMKRCSQRSSAPEEIHHQTNQPVTQAVAQPAEQLFHASSSNSFQPGNYHRLLRRRTPDVSTAKNLVGSAAASLNERGENIENLNENVKNLAEAADDYLKDAIRLNQ